MITSVGNPKIKNMVALRDSARERKKQGCFIGEGKRMFSEVPENALLGVYLTEVYLEKNGEDARLLAGGYELVSDDVMRRLSDTKTPQGIVFCVKKPEVDVKALYRRLEEETPLLLLLDGVQDPGNLGTILRSAEAAGVHGIFAGGETADVFSPKVVRSTMGAVFRLPFLYVSPMEEEIRRLQALHIKVCAAYLRESVDYDSETYTKGCAFLIGNEGEGLTEAVAALADTRVRIPMQGGTESLNAAVAASVLLFEAARQRRASVKFRNGGEV